MSKLNNVQSGSYKPNITATGNVVARACDVLGIFVSAASATPTIALYDSATTTTTDPIVSTFTPVVGFTPIPVSVESGIYIVIGGTVNCTLFYA